MAKERGIAEPAMLATTPRIEKIPAPIMPPTPMLTAASSPMLDVFVESVIGSLPC
jgi:hypothetical protein